MNPENDALSTSGKEFFLVPDNEKSNVQNFNIFAFSTFFFLAAKRLRSKDPAS